MPNRELRLVLNSWPMLEWIKGRPAGTAFEALLERAREEAVSLSMSRINFGEVVYTCRKELRFTEAQLAPILRAFEEVPIPVVSATDDRVDSAVDLKSRYNISYADAFAAGLAIEFGAQLVTGDAEFRALENEGVLELRWVGA